MTNKKINQPNIITTWFKTMTKTKIPNRMNGTATTGNKLEIVEIKKKKIVLISMNSEALKLPKNKIKKKKKEKNKKVKK